MDPRRYFSYSPTLRPNWDDIESHQQCDVHRQTSSPGEPSGNDRVSHGGATAQEGSSDQERIRGGEATDIEEPPILVVVDRARYDGDAEDVASDVSGVGTTHSE